MMQRLDDDTLRRVMTPALLVDLDRVRDNLVRLKTIVGDTNRLRPHVKTSKLARTFKEIVRADIRHFKCATTREAQHLLAVLDAEGHEGDVLVAYPHQGPALERLAQIASEHPKQRLSILSEDPTHAAALPVEVGVFVDLNIGMDRTGIDVTEESRIRSTMHAAGDRLRGIHAYEGHVHTGTSDERRAQAFAAYEPLHDLMSRLEADFEIGELVTSGTPSFTAALAFTPFKELRAFHRVSPGTIIYDDLRTDECEELAFEPAAFVVARVVSHPSLGRVTLDAGSKALAAEAGDPCAAVVEYPGLLARTPSEEHLPCDVTDGPTPPLGTVVHLVPRHVCPTVNLAEDALIVEGGRLVGRAPVSSRAHDLPWPAECSSS